MAKAGCVADDMQALSPTLWEQTESIAVKQMAVEGTKEFEHGSIRKNL